MKRIGYAVVIWLGLSALIPLSVWGLVWLGHHVGDAVVFWGLLGAGLGLWAWKTAGELTRKREP